MASFVRQNGYSCGDLASTLDHYKNIADDLLVKGVVCLGAAAAIYITIGLLSQQ